MRSKILIIFPSLPKYDVEFFDILLEFCDYDIYIAANIKDKNQLTLESYDKHNFNVIHTKTKNLGPFIVTFGLGRIIKSIDPNLVIYNANPRDLSQTYSMIKNKLLGRAVASWSMYHRIGGPIMYSTLHYKLLGYLGERNMCYTRTGKLHQVARGVDSRKIDVIGTAIDQNKVFSCIVDVDCAHRIEVIENEYNLEKKIVLLQVVRLNEIKKPHILINMMEILLKKDDSFVLVLIGGGVLEDEIMEYVSKKMLSDNVIFLGPIYDEVEISAWFKLSDIFVIPTCIGLSAHHAFCYSLPIVTDDSIINQASEFDILNDEFNCLLYKEGDLDHFSEQILRLKNNKPLYKEISKNALKTVREIHTIENKAHNFIKSIEKIIK
jgi:glycosyltransferase involved in cell wall biosynthesis